MPELHELNLALPENGQAPALRVAAAKDAYDITKSLLRANEGRMAVETKVRGMLDGNSPYSPAKLKQAAQSYRTNVNFREAEAIHTDALSPYYDLFSEVPYHCDVKTFEGTPAQKVTWSKTITDEFDWMLRSYDNFDWHMQLALGDMVAFGRGFIFWENDTSWHFTSVCQSNVLVPDGTSNLVEDLDVLVVLQNFRVHELWSKIKDPNVAKDAGWNSMAVMREIATAMPDVEDVDNTLEIRDAQSKIRNNDICESVKSASVPASNVFVKEFDGSITHLIVPLIQNERKNTEGESIQMEYLYKKRGRYDDFRQLFGSLFFDVGDGTWHSVKGLLVKMYPFIEAKNRLRCQAIDNGFLTMSVLVQPTSEAAQETAALQQAGPVTILRNGLQLMQGQYTARVEEAVALDNYLESKLNRNLNQYVARGDARERGNPESAAQVRLEALRQSSLTKTAVNRTYRQLDFIYQEIYRRAVIDGLPDDDGGPNSKAKEFVQRCKDRGVPMDAIKNTYVRAYRNIGNGSPYMRQDAIVQTERLVPLMPESGRMNWLDDAISVATNQEMIERYNPKAAQAIANQSHVDATHDVVAMKNGIRPVVSADQNHLIFAEVYLDNAVNAVRELQQGANPIEVLAFLDMVGPEVAKRLQLASIDKRRAGDIKALESQWNQLSEIADQLRDQIQQSRNGQQQSQQQMTEEQMDQVAFQREQERQDAKVQNDIERKTVKTQVDLDLKAQKTAASIRQKELTRR